MQRRLNGKEDELEKEFEEYNTDVLALTETKKKEHNVTTTNNGHLLILSGVKKEERARAGVGCLIHKKWKCYVEKWESISERVLIIHFKDERKGEKWALIVVYGLDDNENKENKNKFWDELTIATEKLKCNLLGAGDFNARVDTKDMASGGVGTGEFW